MLALALALEPEPEPEPARELAREQVPEAELVRDQVPEAALVPVPWKVRVRGSRKSTVSGWRCRSPRRRTPPAWKQPGGSTARIARTRGQCLRT